MAEVVAAQPAEASAEQNKDMFEQMRSRLKEALEDKRDFEIEYLQLQKNFMRLKNAKPPALPSPKQSAAPTQPSKEEQAKLNKLIAAQQKSDEETKVLREDNEMLKRQNRDLADQYRDQAKKFDQDGQLDGISDQYTNSFKKQIAHLQELLDKKDQ